MFAPKPLGRRLKLLGDENESNSEASDNSYNKSWREGFGIGRIYIFDTNRIHAHNSETDLAKINSKAGGVIAKGGSRFSFLPRFQKKMAWSGCEK